MTGIEYEGNVKGRASQVPVEREPREQSERLHLDPPCLGSSCYLVGFLLCTVSAGYLAHSEHSITALVFRAHTVF